MTTTIRFPYQAATKTHGSEANQIIVLASNITSIPEGGPTTFAPITAWKTIQAGSEAPYCNVMIEFQFTGDGDPGSFQIGDGTIAEAIGLFGQIYDQAPNNDIVPTAGPKFLLGPGTLGMRLGTDMPTIPVLGSTGYSQIICNVGAYDALAVGGINGAIAIPEGAITITARPLRRRIYGG